MFSYFVEQRGSLTSFGRDKTRVVTFRVPHNAAVQIYDYKEKTARYMSTIILTCFTVSEI